jgi:hypothetical protein
MGDKVTKTIRFESDVYEVISEIRRHYPEFEKYENLMLDEMLRIGMLILAAGAERPGRQEYASLDPADLAYQIKQTLHRIVPFLQRHGGIPEILSSTQGQLLAPAQPVVPESAVSADAGDFTNFITDEATSALEDNGIGFLDDES